MFNNEPIVKSIGHLVFPNMGVFARKPETPLWGLLV